MGRLAGFRYRTWCERKHARALAEYECARQARSQELRDAQTLELHTLRLAAAARKEANDRQRQQQREAAERRREELHALCVAHQQQRLLQQQQATAEHEARARAAQLQAEFESLTLASLWGAAAPEPDDAPTAATPSATNASTANASTANTSTANPQQFVSQTFGESLFALLRRRPGH